MTRPLRRAHRRIWIALAILLPLALFAGIAGRRDTVPLDTALDWKSLR